MSEKTSQTRRGLLQALGIGGAILAGTGLAHANNSDRSVLPVGSGGPPDTVPPGQVDEDDIVERTIKWGGQGSEHADQDCEADEFGYWHWVLTRGGPIPIQEGATLTVTFADNTDVTVKGYFKGEGAGAVHFDVFKEGGGTVDSASVTFEGGTDRSLLTISDGKCVDDEEVPDPELDYWQVDFGEGENPPIPPRYYPDDGMWALGDAEDGVTQNPSGRRQQTDGQLGDVDIVGNEFIFDDDGDPTQVTVEFELEEGAKARDLHLAIFSLPGPFDMDEIEDQVLIDTISDEFEGGDEGELTLSFP